MDPDEKLPIHGCIAGLTEILSYSLVVHFLLTRKMPTPHSYAVNLERKINFYFSTTLAGKDEECLKRLSLRIVNRAIDELKRLFHAQRVKLV